MKHLLLSVRDFFSKRKPFLPSAFALVLLCSLTLAPSTAHAGDVVSDVLAWVGGVTIGTVTSPIAIMMWVVFKISSFILGIAGIIFNWAVLVVVFEFAKYFGNSPGMTLAWGILRDFGNIGLIFGFVFMGVATILDLHSYPWKKALPKLVIFAVLLNFSLFATEAIIDTTNVLSATLYSQTYGQGQCAVSDVGCIVNTGLAGVILERLEITTAYAPDTTQSTLSGIAEQFSTPIENILKYVLLSLVTTVAAVVLFAGAFMLISRGVVLAFLMVTSPIGFAGMAIPPLEKLANDWWKKLLDQALFAPVFILLLLVSLKMTDGLDVLVGDGGLTAALSLGNVGDTTGTLLFFVMIMGFMIGSLMLASRFGIYGSEMAIKTAGGAVYGTLGAIGRTTVGRYSNRLANRINTSPFGASYIGRKTLALANIGAKASFDARGGLVGTAAKNLKVDLGKAGSDAKKGYKGTTDARNKRANEVAKGRADAFKAQDTGFDQKAKELGRQETVARAQAAIAQNLGDTKKAARLEAQADELKEQKEKVAIDKAAAQRQRLTREDREVRAYNIREGMSAEQKAEEKDSELKEVATNLKEVAERISDTNIKLEAFKKERARLSAAGEDTSRQDVEIIRLTEERAGHEEEREHWLTEERIGKEQLAAIKKLQGKYEGDVKEMKDPKYAMEQIAQSLDRIAGTRVAGVPVGVFIDAQRLRGEAASIRKERGQTHEEHVLHELQHLFKGHDDHGDDHKEDKGGGGHAAPAAGKPAAAAPH